ncbi:MAG: phosphomannomutase/phosphoglucomutase [Bacilli bacterium]|nr:phosphomannomutase/phosphoglucomutase [Bacilli bacterium]
MINKKIFREYDIRGVYPSEVNEEAAYLIGRSYATMLIKDYNQNTCCVGMDNRYSSPALKKELIRGLCDSGMNVIDLGLCTTPMYFYGCIYTHTFGMMVTASHNPKDDNGFKFCFDSLGNARGKQVYDFRDHTLANKFIDGKGSVENLDIYPYYKSLIKDNISMGNKKLKVVVDPGNGTTSPFAKEIYSMFDNLEILMINDVSDSNFPNHHPDPAVPENLKQLQESVLSSHADIGIAFDGDGDRVGFVDENGNIIPTDKFMVIALRYYFPKMKDKRTLCDVKCSKIVEEEAKKLNGKAIMCRTGASYTRYEINKNNIPFGGEFSGHFVFNDKFPGFDSGIYAGLRMLEILSNVDGSASSLLDGISNYYNTPEIKIAVTDENKFNIVEKVKEYCHSKSYDVIELDGVRVNYVDGWALIRASNTGPNLTLRFEALNEQKLKEISEEFINLVNTLKEEN